MNEIPDAIKRAEEAIKSAEAVIDISLPTAANRIYIAGEIWHPPHCWLPEVQLRGTTGSFGTESRSCLWQAS